MDITLILKILGIYFGIIVLLWLYYAYRIVRLAHYHNIYVKNIENKELNKNVIIASSFAHYLRDAQVYVDTLDICNPQKTKDCQEAYMWTLSNYFRKVRDAFAWPMRAIEKLKMFAPIRKISNKLSWIILAPLEIFASYLLGLFLDTTGIGNKILTFLIDFLNRIFPNIN